MMKEVFEIYQVSSGIEIEVQFESDTVWLSQDQLSVLFQRDQSVISRHLSNVFKEGELEKKSNMQKVHIPNSDKPISYYNLEVIISVGYRVKSIRGTQFRQWATQRLKDFLIKGIAVNEKRLEQLGQEVEVLKSGIRILSRVIEEKSEGAALDWLADFSKGLTE